MNKKPSQILDAIRIVVAGVFALAILAGSFIIFLQIKQQNEPQKDAQGNEELKSELEGLNKEIDKLNSELKNTNTSAKSTVVVKSEQVDASEAGSSNALGSKININSATASELDTLAGIGPSYAARIIEYRDGHGGFKSIEEIKNVTGIGDATFSKIKDQIEI